MNGRRQAGAVPASAFASVDSGSALGQPASIFDPALSKC
jgi:hypothetical protein